MTLNLKKRTEIVKTKNQRNRNMKSEKTEDENLVLQKEKVEDAYKPVMNKIMTPRK